MKVDKGILSGSSFFEISQVWNPKEAAKLPSRTLAYIGDAVYELMFRMEHVKNGIDDAGRLHSEITKKVNSVAQAALFDKIFPGLSEEEQAMVICWRNAKMPAKHGAGTPGEYARATALEAWVGYLFVTGRSEDLRKLFDVAFELLGIA